MKHQKTFLCVLVATAAVGIAANHALAGATPKVYEYSVVGTHIEFDAYGLPLRLEGDVLYRGGKKDGNFAGTYVEDLTPIFFEGTFVGTSGVSVFTFQNGQITTLNTSYIVGMVDGGLLVETTGQVVKNDGTGKFKKVDGDVMSSSTVILGPEFSMNVDLTLTTTR